MRLNMRRHEVEGRRGGDGKKERERRNRPDLSLALISVLAQWTSNSSAGSRRGKDGKSGNRLFVQMKRENQNPRCNPSFQTAIFFSLSFVRPTHRRIRTLSLSSFLILALFHSTHHPTLGAFASTSAPRLSPKDRRVPQSEILRVKKLHSTRQYTLQKKKKEKMRRMRASKRDEFVSPIT